MKCSIVLMKWNDLGYGKSCPVTIHDPSLWVRDGVKIVMVVLV